MIEYNTFLEQSSTERHGDSRQEKDMHKPNRAYFSKEVWLQGHWAVWQWVTGK